MDGYACPVTNCDGLCPSRTKSRGKNSNPDEELLRCDRCGATRSACEADRASRVIRDLLESSQDLVGRGEGHSGLAQAMEVLQEARSRASRCLHRGNWMVGEIYSSLVEIGIELEVKLGGGNRSGERGMPQRGMFVCVCLCVLNDIVLYLQTKV